MRRSTTSKEGEQNDACVILMPFAEEFTNQWKLAVRPAVEAAGMEPLRADETLTANDVVKNVTRCIFEARLIFADVSGSNANVTYELGLAQAIGKQTIVACQNVHDVPHDIQGHSLLVYNPNDIDRFREDLIGYIKQALKQDVGSVKSHVFPDLEFIDDATRTELSYLRKKAKKVEVTAYPPTADLFFNDQLVGRSPQTIRVNPDREIGNTISASNILYFEEHRYLEATEIQKAHVHIVLEDMPPEQGVERQKAEPRNVPKYIRWSRKNPENPALMRAISHYLLFIRAYEDAHDEAVELVEAAPEWHLSYSQVGHVMTKLMKPDRALKYFEIARAMRSDDFIGYYNLACVHSILGDSSSCLSYLSQILETSTVLESYCYLPYHAIEEDRDFDNIRKDPKHGKKFESLARKLQQQWAAFTLRKR